MNRKDFLRVCAILGIGAPINQALASINGRKGGSVPKKVLIVGAGAAGLSAGYYLKKMGVSFTILEASSTYGGRMKTHHDFVDFPIALGAEWVSSKTIPFNQIIDDDTVSHRVDTVGYTANDEYGIWDGSKLVRGNLDDFTDRKFVNGSWLHFFEAFILPSVRDRIQYDVQVTAINYEDDQVLVRTDTEQLTFDKVIVTVPVKKLQEGSISFTPAVPKRKLRALREVVVWDGFKLFIEFKKKFYPAFVDFVIRPATDGQVSYYDAAFGQQTDTNVLGLFAVGKPVERYGSLEGNALKEHVLQELDKIFDSQATHNYIRHISQHWSNDPFIGGAYLSDYEDERLIQKLQEPVDDKVFFAGDCYTSGLDWGHVHNAVFSAKECVDKVLRLI